MRTLRLSSVLALLLVIAPQHVAAQTYHGMFYDKNQSVTATHTFNPSTPGLPFQFGANVKELPIPTSSVAGLPTPGTIGRILQLSSGVSAGSLAVDNGTKWNGETGAELVIALPYGAVGNGVTNDTAAIQAPLATTTPTIVYIPSGSYLIDTVSLGTGVRGIICAPGATIIQNAANENVISLGSASNVLIENCTFQGVAGTVNASSNSAIFASQVSNITVRDCVFTQFRYFAIWLEGVTNAVIDHIDVSNGVQSVMFRGVNRGVFENSRIMDPSTPNTTFITGMTLDSTDGHAFGVSKNIRIAHNYFGNFINAQGILAHAGIDISFVGNIIDNSMIGISVNAFNNTDTIQNVTITGNSIIGTTTSFVGPTGAGNIVVSGFDAGHPAANVSVVGNTGRNANAILQSATNGAMESQYSEGMTISGNTFAGSRANCFALGPSVTVGEITGNICDSVTAAGGQAVGIFVNSTGNEFHASGNRINAVTDGIRIASNNYPGVVIEKTDVQNFTNYAANPTNALIDGVGIYTAGQTTPSMENGRVRYMDIANGGATTITNLTNMVEGQEVTLTFEDANTVINRANAQLAGGANFTSAANAVLKLVKRGSVIREVSRTANNS